MMKQLLLAAAIAGLVSLAHAQTYPGQILIPGSAVGAYPGPNDPAVGTGLDTGHVLPWLDHNNVFTGNGIYPLIVAGSNPYVIGAAGSTINNAINGDTYNVRFTSTHLSGSPITVSYTANGVDTVSTIASQLCAGINANTTLNTNGLPAFCQTVGSGKFNIQWSGVLLPDLALASTGTGSITLAGPTTTLDYANVICGRRIASYVGQSGDNLCNINFYGQSSTGSGAMDGVAANIGARFLTAANPTISGQLSFSTAQGASGFLPSMALSNGMILFDSSGAQPTSGFLGAGWVNVPTSAGYAVAGGVLASSAGTFGIANNVFGGSTTNAPLNLQATNNGSPAGDFVQIKAGGNVGYKFDGTTSTLGTPGSFVGALAFANATSGTVKFQPTTGALGSSVLTLPAATGVVATTANVGNYRFALTGVNFNSGNTDNPIAITLPPGISRYAVAAVRITNASASLSTATIGVFTSTGGGGQTIAATQAITVTATGSDSNNNAQSLTLTNAGSEAYNDATLQIRIVNPQGSAATGDIVVVIAPMT